MLRNKDKRIMSATSEGRKFFSELICEKKIPRRDFLRLGLTVAGSVVLSEMALIRSAQAMIGFRTMTGHILMGSWDLSKFSYSGNFIATGLSNPQSAVFSSDGSRMFVCNWDNSVTTQYTVSTPWDISTASVSGTTYNTTALDSKGGSVVFNLDGTKMYFLSGNNGSNTLFQLSLSTAWDIGTASYTGKSVNLTAVDNFGCYACFSDNGLNFYDGKWGSPTVYHWSLSTAWDISTSSYVGSYVTGQGTNMQVGGISPDGTTAIISSGVAQGAVYQYSLATPYVISSASYTGKSVSISGLTTSFNTGVSFGLNAMRMYVCTSGGSIFQFNSA